MSQMFDAQRLRDWAFEPIRHRYSERDTMLYALSLGAGMEPVFVAKP